MAVGTLKAGVNSQDVTASTGQDIVDTVNYVYGLLESVTAPPEMTAIPSLSGLIAYKYGNAYSCNKRPEDLIDFNQFTQTIYVNPNISASGSGNSWAFAYKTLSEAVARAITDAVGTKIMCKAGVFYRGDIISGFNTVRTLTAPLAIIGVNGRVVNAVADNLSWSVNATYSNVYESARSTAVGAIDPSIKTETGAPYQYKPATDLADCAARAGTWWTNNTTVYVHAQNDAVVSTNNALIMIHSACASFITSYDLYVSGVDFFGGRYGAFAVTATSTATIVAEDCRAMFAAGGSFASPTLVDGFDINGGTLFAGFNCEASYNSKDGINLSLNGASIPACLTVNCKGFLNGQNFESSVSCNGITYHQGVKGIDIGSEWTGSFGTNAGFVNDDTEYWGYGVTAGKSDGDKLHSGGIDWGAFGAWSGAATIWLEHCTDIGSSIGVYCDTADSAEAYIRSHSGTGERVGTTEYGR